MAADSDDKKDGAPGSTHIGSAGPPRIKLPTPGAAAPAPPAPEATPDATANVPVAPRLPPREPAAPPEGAAPAPPTAAPPPADEDEGETVFISHPVHSTVSLQRVQPPGRSEIIHLDLANYTIGRSHTCTIRLYSPAASREHARLVKRDGRWFVEPIEDRVVVANGAKATAPIALTHKMRLQFGGDELVFFDESATGTAAGAAAPPRVAPAPSSRRLWLFIGIALAAAAALWILWLLTTR